MSHEQVIRKNIVDNNRILSLGTEELLPIPTPGQGYLLKNTLRYKFSSILDIGAGGGGASRFLAMKGKKVTAIGMNFNWYGDLAKRDYPNIEVMDDVAVCEMKIIEDESIEAIWCAHTLEHVRNVGKALDEMFRVLKPEGLLFLSVPPFSHDVVGGHISVGWNIGILMYNLIISGFDVKSGEFIKHKSNIAAFVRKKESLPFKVRLDTTDMETLKEHYPPSIHYLGTVAEKNIHFNGDLNAVNWSGEIPEIEETQIVHNIRFNLKRALQEITPPILISRIYHPLKQLRRAR